MSTPEVIALGSFSRHEGEIGRKLRRLAALAGWGYRVPDGFALTRAAVEVLAARDPSAAFPARLAASVEREHAALIARLGRANPALAVRSASAAEDGDRRSFAGIYETVLGVRGLDEIEAAIEVCVASARGARVDAYAGAAAGGMTIGVQELIAGRASGVMFSRHPVTHRADRLVIEAVFGLGSAMIDGEARPDHIEIGRADRRVLRYEVGDKQRRAVLRDGGGVRIEETSEAERRARCLGAREIDELCRAALDIEAHVGRAVDVEWVVDGGGALVIVQARPITSGPREGRAPVRWDPLAFALHLRGARRDR